MRARNLPLYQSPAAWPVSAQPRLGADLSGNPRHPAITWFGGRRRNEGGLFWLAVAGLALVVGVATWFAF